MVEATRSKFNMDRLEDVIVKLSSSHLSMSTKIDDLIHHMTQLETNQHNQHQGSSLGPSLFLSPIFRF